MGRTTSSLGLRTLSLEAELRDCLTARLCLKHLSLKIHVVMSCTSVLSGCLLQTILFSFYKPLLLKFWIIRRQA